MYLIQTQSHRPYFEFAWNIEYNLIFRRIFEITMKDST